MIDPDESRYAKDDVDEESTVVLWVTTLRRQDDTDFRGNRQYHFSEPLALAEVARYEGDDEYEPVLLGWVRVSVTYAIGHFLRVGTYYAMIEGHLAEFDVLDYDDEDYPGKLFAD